MVWGSNHIASYYMFVWKIFGLLSVLYSPSSHNVKGLLVFLLFFAFNQHVWPGTFGKENHVQHYQYSFFQALAFNNFKVNLIRLYVHLVVYTVNFVCCVFFRVGGREFPGGSELTGSFPVRQSERHWWRRRSVRLSNWSQHLRPYIQRNSLWSRRWSNPLRDAGGNHRLFRRWNCQCSYRNSAT